MSEIFVQPCEITLFEPREQKQLNWPLRRGLCGPTSQILFWPSLLPASTTTRRLNGHGELLQAATSACGTTASLKYISACAYEIHHLKLRLWPRMTSMLPDSMDTSKLCSRHDAGHRTYSRTSNNISRTYVASGLQNNGLYFLSCLRRLSFILLLSVVFSKACSGCGAVPQVPRTKQIEEAVKFPIVPSEKPY